eukprot:5569837-Prymnesium_polylepis.1
MCMRHVRASVRSLDAAAAHVGTLEANLGAVVGDMREVSFGRCGPAVRRSHVWETSMRPRNPPRAYG